MKLNVSGIETIEVTDPKGLCNQPVPQVGQVGIPTVPGPGTIPWHQQPASPWPTPSPQPAIPIFPHTPYSGDPLPGHTKIWSKTLPNTVASRFDPDHGEKWGVGIPEGLTTEPQKWEKNWQAKMGQAPEGQNEVKG